MPNPDLPPGFWLAPDVPTIEMSIAFAEAFYSKKRSYDDHNDLADCWQGIRDAAPQAPVLGPDDWLAFAGAPRNGTKIMAWHKIHACPVAVFYKPNSLFKGASLYWLEVTRTTAWPEEAFIGWRPMGPHPKFIEASGG